MLFTIYFPMNIFIGCCKSRAGDSRKTVGAGRNRFYDRPTNRTSGARRHRKSGKFWYCLKIFWCNCQFGHLGCSKFGWPKHWQKSAWEKFVFFVSCWKLREMFTHRLASEISRFSFKRESKIYLKTTHQKYQCYVLFSP